MRVQVLSDNLETALKAVKPSVGMGNLFGSPVVLLDAKAGDSPDAGRLEVTATNLGTVSRFTVGAKVAKSGQAVVPALLITKVLAQTVYDGPVSLRSDEKTGDLSISSQAVKNITVVRTSSADEFPLTPDPTFEIEMALAFSEVKRIMTLVGRFASTDHSRPTLAGICVDVKPEGLILGATDGFRLSSYTTTNVAIEGELPKTGHRAIVPVELLKAFVTLARFADKADDDTVIWRIARGLKGGQPAIKMLVSESAFVYGSLLEGRFPEYETLFPKNPGVPAITAPAGDLLGAARSAAVIAAQKSNMTNIAILEPGKIRIYARGDGDHSNDGILDAKTTDDAPFYRPATDEAPDEGVFVFNPSYVIEFIEAASEVGTDVLLYATRPNEPMLVQAETCSTWRHLIMPMSRR